MNHRWKEGKYLSVDTSKETDVFYPDLKRIQREQIKYEPARNVSKTYNEIDSMGQKTITGKMAISKEDYSQLTALAKEGITSRAEISELEQSANYYRQKYFDSAVLLRNEWRHVSSSWRIRGFSLKMQRSRFKSHSPKRKN